MCPKLDKNYFDEFDETDESQNTLAIKGLRRSGRQKKHKKKSTNQVHEIKQLQNEENFTYTYQASRFESGWLEDSLGVFYQEQWITDVLRLIKGGKEASVYQCLSDESTGELYLAAKVYRPRQFRNLKNDKLYREGRAYLDENGHDIHDKRVLHAIRKKSSFGSDMQHTSWIEHEMKTMQLLWEAGADIPQPFASANNAILMGYFGGIDQAAPALNEITLEVEEAKRLFEQVLFNIELMLSKQRIHADLSAYNILYWDGNINIIDFPQAICPDQNQHAFTIFERDVKRICQYFSRFGVKTDFTDLADSLWNKYYPYLKPAIDFFDGDDASYSGDTLLYPTCIDELGV